MVILVVAILAGLTTLALLFKPFFGDSDGFLECLRYSIQPDMLSWLQGDLGEDIWAEIRLGLWLGCGLAVGLAVHVGLDKLFS